ncbi:hypothetical protein TKK_0000772 [Trichogramma kaykai]
MYPFIYKEADLMCTDSEHATKQQLEQQKNITTEILTYWDYHDLVRSKELRRLPEDVMLHLYEKVPRVFCRRWALKYFDDLIRYRLPILCCENIIDQLMNEDPCNICFATTGQDLY